MVEKIQIGEVWVEDMDGHRINTEYFAFRDKEAFKERVAEFVRRQYNDEGVEEFIREDVMPTIENAFAGLDYINPSYNGEEFVGFRVHNIPTNVVEEAVWDRIRDIWDRIQAIEVSPEAEYELLQNAGYITASDGGEYAIKIEPAVTDKGFVNIVTENGDEVDVEDFKDDYTYDPFGLLRWLGDIYKTVKMAIGGEKDE